MKELLKLIAILLVCASCFGGMTFDGTDDKINLQTVTNPTSEAFSCSFWFNTTTTNTQYILNANNAGGTRAFTIILTAISTVLQLQFQKADSTQNGALFLIRRCPVAINTLYHAVITHSDSFTNATTVKIYINGTEASTYQLSQNGTGVSDTLTGAWHLSGRTSDTSFNYSGTLNEVAYWNSVLTPNEILQLYSSKIKGMPLQIQSANLKMYLPLDDVNSSASGDGVTFKDLSGNGKYGTGSDGANNTGLTGYSEQVLSYP